MYWDEFCKQIRMTFCFTSMSLRCISNPNIKQLFGRVRWGEATFTRPVGQHMSGIQWRWEWGESLYGEVRVGCTSETHVWSYISNNPVPCLFCSRGENIVGTGDWWDCDGNLELASSLAWQAKYAIWYLSSKLENSMSSLGKIADGGDS
jgi:hypothetical protein